MFLFLNLEFDFYFSLALTHLFVARFIQHFMYSKGLCTSIEPFKRFIPIGKINQK
jgi:leucyl-tRNA synthetase